jgi:PAS domain S-box-containing protein
MIQTFQSQALGAHRLGKIVEESLNEIYIFGTKDLKFEFVNRGALQNLGYSADEMSSLTPLDIKPRISEAEFLDLIAPLANGETETLVFETVHERKDGSTYPVEVHLQMITDDVGRLYCAIILDITSRKESERVLVAAIDAANESNKAKSEFIASISHEIRTPLNAIIGFSEALLSGVGIDDPQKLRDSLNIIANSGRGVNNIISDLLDLSIIDTGNLEFEPVPTLPSDVFRSRLPEIREILGQRNMNFQGVRGSDKKILVDHQRLTQIFLNFISNAAKYGRENGNVEFGCYETVQGQLRVYVSDDGPGVDDRVKERIFVPFERGVPTGSSIAGIGLGLAISKRLTEVMGGEIGLDSVPGNGSTFWIEFPILDDTPKAPEAVEVD